MAKLRLVAWTLSTGGIALVLLRDVVWDTADAAVMAMAVVRVVAGVLAAYLCVATVATVGRVRLPAPAIVRRLVAGAIGSGLLIAPMTASASTTRDQPPVEVPVLRRVPEAESVEPTPGPVPAAPIVDTVVVAPGDHLWSIAERTLAARLGHAPIDAEIVPYWTALVTANRDRLVSGDPDLVFPGEELVLPSWAHG